MRPKRHIVFHTDTLSLSAHTGWLCFSSLQRCLLAQNALLLVSLTVFNGDLLLVASHPPTLPLRHRNRPPIFWMSGHCCRHFADWCALGTPQVPGPGLESPVNPLSLAVSCTGTGLGRLIIVYTLSHRNLAIPRARGG